MEYLEWAWFTVKWFFALWALSYFVRFFLPYHTQETLERMDLFLLERITAIPVFLSNTWLFAATILYFLGNFAVLLLLFFGLFMISYSIYLHFTEVQSTFEWWYRLAITLVDEKAAWSGATMVVGATVAVGHMWKLNLDRKQYYEKREKERHQRYEEKRKQDLERFKRGTGLI